MCNITSMPLAHVYRPTVGPAHGELQLSSKLAKSSFISFCNRLAETVDEVLLPQVAAGEAAESRGGGEASMSLAEPGTPEGTRDVDAAIEPPT